MQNVLYEWDLETLDITDPNDPEVLDHEHSDTLTGLFTAGALHVEADRDLCLVRTDHKRGGGREWAYVTAAEGLGEFFRDANNVLGSPIPQKFRLEFDRLKDKISFAPKPAPTPTE